MAEVWRFVWKATPKPFCAPDANAITCPCAGFAFGESGELDLVRMRGDSEIDRLPLTPLFPDGKRAVMQRWNLLSSDNNILIKKNIIDEVSKRPTIQAMRFGDYNQDGRSTEFFIQTANEPCGRRMGVIVGLTRSGKLHAFGTVRHPERPLVMRLELWDDLRTVNGRAELIDLPCGDHGSANQVSMQLRTTAAGIEATRRTFACAGALKNAGVPTRLISEEQL